MVSSWAWSKSGSIMRLAIFVGFLSFATATPIPQEFAEDLLVPIISSGLESSSSSPLSEEVVEGSGTGSNDYHPITSLNNNMMERIKAENSDIEEGSGNGAFENPINITAKMIDSEEKLDLSQKDESTESKEDSKEASNDVKASGDSDNMKEEIIVSTVLPETEVFIPNENVDNESKESVELEVTTTKDIELEDVNNYQTTAITVDQESEITTAPPEVSVEQESDVSVKDVSTSTDSSNDISTSEKPDEVVTIEPTISETTIASEVVTPQKEEVTETPTAESSAIPDTIIEEEKVAETSSSTSTTESNTEIPTPALPEISVIPKKVDEELPISTTESVKETPDPEALHNKEAVYLKEASLALGKKSDNLKKDEDDEEYSKTKVVAMYTLGALLVVSLVILIVIIVFRRRHSAKYHPDEERDLSGDKSVINKGKYKDDADELSVKNNEITPLVIKQNSQINKFEKNPNFSSPKNLNTRANEKNIEKDNVLKSTQGLIEGESDDEKKEDVDEEKKIEEESVEKVVVRTLLDEDSIPRKPVIISRNGHNYQSLPGGETKT